jgi:cytochrome c553
VGLAETGRRLFEEGDPNANVPACAACHGPEATGQGPNARLAGQLFPYVVKRLLELRQERAADESAHDTSSIMGPIARSLSKSQRDALAAYVANLR